MKLIKEIESLSYDELLELNRLIVTKIKSLRASTTRQQMQQFDLGNRVEFMTDEGDCVSGIVAKLNKKTVGLITDDGERWNVSPALLKLSSGDAAVQNIFEIIDFNDERKA